MKSVLLFFPLTSKHKLHKRFKFGHESKLKVSNKVNAEMGRKPTKQPSFFKVLLHDFTNFLSIPNKFRKNHIPLSLGKCVLRGPYGKRSVELERRKNRVFFCNHGWHCFVKDHRLHFGDFLVFRYDGKRKFKVKVYDRTCCEIDVEAPKRRNDTPISPSSNEGCHFDRVKDEFVDDQETESYNSDSENVNKKRRNNDMSGKRLKIEDVHVKETSTRTIIFKSEHPCFKANITSKYSRTRLRIPQDLVVTKGVESNKTIDVEDSTGKLWSVRLVSKLCRSHVYLFISVGWSKCFKANNIVLGDVVVFEFVAETVMRLHILKVGVKAEGGDNKPVYVVLDAPNVNNNKR